MYSLVAHNSKIFFKYDEKVQFVKCLNYLGFPKPKNHRGKIWREIKRIVLSPMIYYYAFDKRFRLKKALKRFKPDFVIDNTQVNTLNSVFKKEIGFKGIKIVHSHFAFYDQYKKNNLEAFKNIVLLSAGSFKDFKQKYPQANFHIIPNFIPQIPKETTNYSVKNVVSVGRFTEEKGFLRLVEIWGIIQKDLSFKDWKLTIVGEGKELEAIKEKIHSLKLEDSIILKPFTKEIEKEYLQASIYAMASYWEGFGMVLVESASFGLPAIAFDIKTGPSDIIKNEKSGFLIPDGDLEGYAEKLKALMQDENLRKQMGTKAKEIVKERFSKEAITKKWFELFRELNNKV